MAWPNLPISLYWFVLKVEFPLSDIGKQNFEHLQILNPFLRAFGSTIKISFRLKLQVSKRFIWKFIYREEMQSLEGRSSWHRSLEYPELLRGNGRGKWFVISYETPLLFIRIIAKLSSRWIVKWLVELRLALSLIITTPTRESRDAAWYWPYMVSR